MSILACVIGLAAGLSCDPNRPLTPGVRAGGGIASLANQDSVSASLICGNRVSLKNMNAELMSVRYSDSAAAPQVFSYFFLPPRIQGQPYSETYYLVAGSEGTAKFALGTTGSGRVIYLHWGSPSCPTTAAVSAHPANGIDATVRAAGAAYMTVDTVNTHSYGRYSKKRLLLEFQSSASQAIRQAVIDAIGGTVLGGDRLRVHSDGMYYVELGVSTDSGLKPIMRTVNALKRNTAVKSVALDYTDMIVPLHVTPNDGGGFAAWLVQSHDISKANWHLEVINAPQAWGCATGDSAVKVAWVDQGLYDTPDITRQRDVSSSSFSVSGITHATQVGSIMAARGNDSTGMTGVTWRAHLRFFWKDDAVPSGEVAKFTPTDSTSNAFYNTIRAAVNGYRVINLSIGHSWLNQNGHKPNLNLLDTANADIEPNRIENDHWALRLQYMDQLDSVLGLKKPLIVIAAGNDAVDASWNGMVGTLGDAMFASLRAHVIVVGGSKKMNGSITSLWHNGTAPNDTGSNFGNFVDVLAPAEGIYGLTGPSSARLDTGTSFAAPQVSGVAALLLSVRPNLDGVALKALILAGADSSRYHVSDTSFTTPRGVLDAYQSLRALARSPGGPLCGNRVWSDGVSVFARRGSSTETVYSGTDSLTHFRPFHGGRKLGLVFSDPANFSIDSSTGLLFNSGTKKWDRSTLPVPDTGYASQLSGTAKSSSRAGQYGRMQGISHTADSAVTADLIDLTSWTSAVLHVSLGTPVAPASFWGPVDIPLTVEQPPFSLVPAYVADLGGFVDVRTDSRAISRLPTVAFSPAGKYAYVAVNWSRSVLISPDTTRADYGRTGIFRGWADGVRVLRIELSTRRVDTVWFDPSANIRSLAVSEDGKELAFALSRDTVIYPIFARPDAAPWRFNGMDAGWQPLTANNTCYQGFRTLAALQPDSLYNRSSTACYNRDRTLATFNLTVPSRAGTTSSTVRRSRVTPRQANSPAPR